MDPFVGHTIWEKKNEKVLTECYTTLHVSECNFSCQNSPIIKVKEWSFSQEETHVPRMASPPSPPPCRFAALSPFSCTNFSISICFSMLFSLCEKKKMNTDLVNQVCFTFCHIFNVYCGGCCWGSLLLLYTLNPFILNWNFFCLVAKRGNREHC